MNPLHRRRVLRGGATLGAAAVAGCLGFGTPPAESVPVTLRNDDDASHRLAVTVADGASETVLDVAERLRPGEEADASFENPSESIEYRVAARLDGGDAGTDPVTVGAGSGVHSVTVAVTDDGDVEIYAART